MIDKVINLLKNDISIPRVLLTDYKDLKLNEKELITLIYILNEKEKQFNPAKISEDLKYSLPEVLEIIESLNKNDLLTIVTIDNNGLREEVVDLSNLYKKLAYLIINEEDTKEDKSNIYDLFEQEFGRTLSPTEYELISGWLDSDYTEEIIGCALKEAVYNGVSNLRYIDKILYEWKKKGINTKEDVMKDKQNFKKKKETKKTEMFDYDWLNDEQDN